MGNILNANLRNQADVLGQVLQSKFTVLYLGCLCHRLVSGEELRLRRIAMDNDYTYVVL